MNTFSRKVTVTALAMFCLWATHSPARAVSAPVTLLRTPNGGIQPQAVVDDKGVLHLIYYHGDPSHGDVFYVRKPLGADAAFSAPLRVNQKSGSAIAIGTIRGAQIALGRRGQVYVAWNGSSLAAKSPDGGAGMLFTRLRADRGGFEPERQLITETAGVDGGGSVAADGAGMVYVTWHSTPTGQREAQGGVYISRSRDDGATFQPERRIAMPALGACGCCGMRALATTEGVLYVVYRAATDSVHRDTVLLVSKDRGDTFALRKVEPWDINACPMSLFSLTPGVPGAIAAWETKGRASWARVAADGGLTLPTAVPTGSGQKYPIALTSATHETLVVWVEGAGWEKGGDLAYQRYGAQDAPIGERGFLPGAIPVWSLAAAVARPDGSFVVIY
jgi:hypothetical protein